MSRGLVAITGASGFIGSNLVSTMLQHDYTVRAITRKPMLWNSDRVETVTADALKEETLIPALKGVRTAYYLIHSMHAGTRFAELDEIAARNFLSVAEHENVERIIYLGGLGEKSSNLSEHLASRARVGEILSQGRIPTTTLRAAIILGHGGVFMEYAPTIGGETSSHDNPTMG